MRSGGAAALGGMQSLAERLDVRLGHAVRRVEQTEGRVIVSSDQGRFEARAMGRMPQEDRRGAAIRCFVHAFGDPAARPLRYFDKVWEHDEWAGGGYGAFMLPGVLTSVGPALREAHGRVHWAGTETAIRWSGYIDGAISSGKRAAAEVLRAELGEARTRTAAGFGHGLASRSS